MDTPGRGRLTTTLLQRAGAGESASQITAAIVSTWRAIDTVMNPVIGKQGVAAMYLRSVHLSKAEHRWLVGGKDGIPAAMDFDAVAALYAGQTSNDVAAAGAAILAAFYALLASMVGPALTQQLLGSIWEQSINGTDEQDASS